MISPGSIQDTDELLARRKVLELHARETPELTRRLRELRIWQASRLARTYADLRNDPCCSQAAEFFLTDLYGPQDFSDRDRDLTRAWTRLKRTLSSGLVDVLTRVIELQVITAELDQAMAERLPEGPIDSVVYSAAYRAVGRPDARQRQLQLILDIGADLDRVVKHDWIGIALRAAHIPAYLAGFGVLQDFLERGFCAFQAMGSARRLLDTIRDRETRMMEVLLSGTGDPFAVSPGPEGTTGEPGDGAQS